jgi:hypothetical protein
LVISRTKVVLGAKGVCRMKRLPSVKVIALVVAAGTVGYIVGPPVAAAVTSLVTIKGAGSTNKAKVNGTGQLLVDTEATTQNSTCYGCGPSGEDVPLKALDVQVTGGFVAVDAHGAGVIDQGTASRTLDSCGGVTEAVTVNNDTANTTVIDIFADTDFDETTPRVLIWTGTIPAGTHLNDTFGTGGVGFGDSGGIEINETGGTARWFVYGNGFCL